MGSITTQHGKIMLPVIDEEAKNSDPWKRNYHQPPPFKTLVPRSFPIIDIRPQLFHGPLDLLQKYGFGVVKHKSAALVPATVKDTENEEDVLVNLDLYYEEMRNLVKDTLGARHVFITHSISRGGQVPENYEVPKGLDKSLFNKLNPQLSDSDKDVNAAELPINVPTGKPIRIAHQDYTPLGARQSTRHQRDDIYKAGLETGVIAAEDRICQKHELSAQDRESDSVIEEEYNGPRYAAYSIWRPLRTVTGDPLAMSPRQNRTANLVDGPFVYHHYNNKVPGPEHLGGDYLKEYAVLGLAKEEAELSEDAGESLEWYYVSNQEADEVLFVKLFDSAALGQDASHAGAPWHVSPDLGESGDDSKPRTSVELRVVAFW